MKAPSSEGEEQCTEQEEREPASMGSVQGSISRGSGMWKVWLWGGGARMGKEASQGDPGRAMHRDEEPGLRSLEDFLASWCLSFPPPTDIRIE